MTRLSLSSAAGRNYNQAFFIVYERRRVGIIIAVRPERSITAMANRKFINRSQAGSTVSYLYLSSRLIMAVRVIAEHDIKSNMA
jgi:hypothetical protein